MASTDNNDGLLLLLLENRPHELPCNHRNEGILSKVRGCVFHFVFHLTHASKGLSQEDRNAVQQMDLDAGFGTNDDVDAISHTVPPGEEGFDISHEGGEFEVFEDLVAGLAAANGQ
jgi:hypothetical protein